MTEPTGPVGLLRQIFSRFIVTLAVLFACGCSRTPPGDASRTFPGSPRPNAPLPALWPGAFRITDHGVTASGASRFVAGTDGTPQSCQFEILVEGSKPARDDPFAFANAALMRRPGSDCSTFLRGLARQLGFEGELPRTESADRLPASIAILGTNQSRSSVGEALGSFASDPPGHWIAAKLFLKDGEGEVFLNLNASDGIGEFSIKDEEYAAIVVTELAKILLPKAG